MTKLTAAQKVRVMLESRDKTVLKQAVELVACLDFTQNELRKDFINTFAHCFSDEAISIFDYKEIKEARKKNEKAGKKPRRLSKIKKTKHNLHSLCHSDLLWSELWDNYCLDDLFYFTCQCCLVIKL